METVVNLAIGVLGLIATVTATYFGYVQVREKLAREAPGSIPVESSSVYDAFISHAASDLSPARKLERKLVKAGIRVFLLEWVDPGVVGSAAWEAALLRSANCILVFSRATMADPAIRDYYAAMLRHAQVGTRRFIPVLIDDVKLPPLAAIRKPVNLYNVSDAEYDKRLVPLIRALRPPESGLPSSHPVGTLPDATSAISVRTSVADTNTGGSFPAPDSDALRGVENKRTRIEIRMGFGVDIVGYGARSAPMKEDVQERLARLAREVLKDLRLGLAETDSQSTDDGMNVFLPVAVEAHDALPILIRSWQKRLALDNQRFRDHLRLRMAAAVGPVELAVTGFAGSAVVELSCLLGSDLLRQAIVDYPDIDLAVLVSDQLHSSVFEEGYAGLDVAKFRRHPVRLKECSGYAWLWTG
jgi:hypothetical protein